MRKLFESSVGIYCIRNTENNKRYIGGSSNLRERKKAHFKKLRRGISNIYLQEDYNKYGKEHLIFELIEYCRIGDLIEREQVWIDFYKSYEREFGYNICPKSDGSVVAEETRKRISDMAVGNKRCLGYVHTEETKKRMSEAQKGKKYSEETKQKDSKRMMGNTIAKGHKSWLGKKHSEESKKKMSDKKKGKKHTEESRKRMSEAQKLRQSKNREIKNGEK